MTKFSKLAVGSTITFTRKPVGSYLSENTPYVVESICGNTAHFRNPVTGGATFERASDIALSEFSVKSAA